MSWTRPPHSLTQRRNPPNPEESARSSSTWPLAWFEAIGERSGLPCPPRAKARSSSSESLGKASKSHGNCWTHPGYNSTWGDWILVLRAPQGQNMSPRGRNERGGQLINTGWGSRVGGSRSRDWWGPGGGIRLQPKQSFHQLFPGHNLPAREKRLDRSPLVGDGLLVSMPDLLLGRHCLVRQVPNGLQEPECDKN